MGFYVTEMTEGHIEQVVEIENQSFSIPWSKKAFQESMSYEHANFLVAVDSDTGNVAGYVGMYKVFNEGDITNIAVLPMYRGRGVGTLLISEMMKKALSIDIRDIMLEVRESNMPARKLYKKMGFTDVGIRKNFYEKPRENAVIMLCHLLPL